MAKCRKVGAAKWGEGGKKKEKVMAVRKTAAGLRLKKLGSKKTGVHPKARKDYKGGENTFRPTKRITKIHLQLGVK